MEIGQKLREIRIAKKLSQGDIEHRTGLLRCYTSRVENGYTVPTLETLEKYARGFQIPLYRFFTDGQPVREPDLPVVSGEGQTWGVEGKERDELRAFRKALSKMDEREQKLLLILASKMAVRDRKPRS